MIIGAHSIIYSTNPDSDRAFLRDVLGLSSVDAGGGWLIFALPPAEVAVHPSEANDVHEFYLMCDDITRLVAAMRKRGVSCSPVEQREWGLLTRVLLPGGGKLGIYEPRHTRPTRAAARRTRRPAASRPVKAGRKAGSSKSSGTGRTRRHH